MPLTIRRRLVDRVRQWRKLAYAVCAGLVVLGRRHRLSLRLLSGVKRRGGPGAYFLRPQPGVPLGRGHEPALSVAHPRVADSQDVVNWFTDQLPERDQEDHRSRPVRSAHGERHGDHAQRRRRHPGHEPGGDPVAAPRDMPPVTKIEPLAYTSGTAALLELIQVFYAETDPRRRPSSSCRPRTVATGGLGVDHFLSTSEYCRRRLGDPDAARTR